MEREHLTADICDEFGDLITVLPNIFSDFGRRKIFEGEVFTLKVDNDNSLVRELLTEEGNGRVLFVDGGGSSDCALLGGNLALLGCQNKWAGIVVYGFVRDSQELKEIDFGVKALGTNPRRSIKAGQGKKKISVKLGEIAIESGQYIYSDQDGIILAPQALKSKSRDSV